MKILEWLKRLYSKYAKAHDASTRTKDQILTDLRMLDFNSPEHLAKARSLFAECYSWARSDWSYLTRLSNFPCRPKLNLNDKDLIEIADVVHTMRLAALVVVSAVLIDDGDEYIELAVMSLKYQAAFLRYMGYEECDFPIAFKWDSAEVAKETILQLRNSGKSKREICDMVTDGLDELASHIKRRVARKYDLSNSRNEMFWQYIPSVVHRTSRNLFEQNHFSEAVEAALKEINVIVKKEVLKRTGNDVDGVDLMHRAFSPKKPVIELSNDECEDTRRSEQQGYMDLFAGAMSALRNPKAHANVSMTKDDAVRQLMLAGLLLHRFESFVHQHNSTTAAV